MARVSDFFTIGVGDWSGNVIDQEVGQFGAVSISESLDSGLQMSMDLRGTSPAAQQVDGLVTDLFVLRDGTPWARCRAVEVQQSFGPDGDDALGLTAVDYKRLMNARHLQSALSFSSIDQAEIIWQIIQHTQAQPGGDFGITEGILNGGSINRDRSYEWGENIGDILGNLSEVIDGPWWGIDALLQLQVLPFDEFPTQPTPILLGVTARSMSRSSGVSAFANSALVDGDDSQTVGVSYDATDILTDPRGRWERAEGFPSVTEQDTLQEKAEGLVEASKSPLAEWQCQIEPSRYLTDAPYAPGDFVELVIPPSTVGPVGTPRFSVPGQVVQVDLTISADGEATVQVVCVELPS